MGGWHIRQTSSDTDLLYPADIVSSSDIETKLLEI